MISSLLGGLKCHNGIFKKGQMDRMRSGKTQPLCDDTNMSQFQLDSPMI